MFMTGVRVWYSQFRIAMNTIIRKEDEMLIIQAPVYIMHSIAMQHYLQKQHMQNKQRALISSIVVHCMDNK